MHENYSHWKQPRWFILLSLVFFLGTPCAGLFLPLPAYAGTLSLDDPAYGLLEELELRGLITSGHLATRPIGMEEARRLFAEARDHYNESRPRLSPAESRVWDGILSDLKIALRIEEEEEDAGFHKPYFRWIHDDSGLRDFNRNGDSYRDGENLRAGLLWEHDWRQGVQLQLRPEYRGDLSGGDALGGALLEGFGVFRVRNFELTAGRQPLWWGPGDHGALLLSNNAAPFDLIKLSSDRAFFLPWSFRHLGTLKPTLFLTQLEGDRGDYPHPRLLGMRFDFRPAPAFQFSLSRVIQFGGQGRKPLSVKDWFQVLLATDTTEHGYAGKTIDNNQLLSVDASVLFRRLPPGSPSSAVKIYGEWGFEDSSGNGTPTDSAYLAGFLATDAFFIPGLLWRGEYAATAYSRSPGSWYRHGVYTDGYTYRDRIIGHAMGGDSVDFMTRMTYTVREKLHLGMEWSRTRLGVHQATPEVRRRLGLSGWIPVGRLAAGASWIDETDDPEGGSSAGDRHFSRFELSVRGEI